MMEGIAESLVGHAFRRRRRYISRDLDRESTMTPPRFFRLNSMIQLIMATS